MAHWSSCAVHNEPALPVGPCDCGNDAPELREMVGFFAQLGEEQKKLAIEYQGEDC